MLYLGVISLVHVALAKISLCNVSTCMHYFSKILVCIMHVCKMAVRFTDELICKYHYSQSYLIPKAAQLCVYLFGTNTIDSGFFVNRIVLGKWTYMYVN